MGRKCVEEETIRFERGRERGREIGRKREREAERSMYVLYKIITKLFGYINS